MSRWFPDSLNLRVAAAALELQLIAGKEGRDWSRAIAPDDGGVIGTQSVCATLDSELLALTAIDLSIDVVLQSPWVRYCLIPWNADFTSPADHASFVQHCFFDVYGEMARRWTVQSSVSRYGKAALGAAIDSDLLSGLSRSVQKMGRKLIGVRPDLTARIELAHSSVNDGTFWFVLADPSNYTLLLMHAGSPMVIQVVGRREADLETLLERAWRSSGLDQERCRVYLDISAAASIEVGESRLGWQMTRLPRILPSTQKIGQRRVLSKMAG